MPVKYALLIAGLLSLTGDQLYADEQSVEHDDIAALKALDQGLTRCNRLFLNKALVSEGV